VTIGAKDWNFKYVWLGFKKQSLAAILTAIGLVAEDAKEPVEGASARGWLDLKRTTLWTAGWFCLGRGVSFRATQRHIPAPSS
jgi:hypothetical protein